MSAPKSYFPSDDDMRRSDEQMALTERREAIARRVRFVGLVLLLWPIAVVFACSLYELGLAATVVALSMMIGAVLLFATA